LKPDCNKKPSIGLKRKTFEIGDKLISQCLFNFIRRESKSTAGKESIVVDGLDNEEFAYKKLRLRLMAKKKPQNLNLNILNTN